MGTEVSLYFFLCAHIVRARLNVIYSVRGEGGYTSVFWLRKDRIWWFVQHLFVVCCFDLSDEMRLTHKHVFPSKNSLSYQQIIISFAGNCKTQVKIHDKTLGEILKPHELHSVAMASQFKEYAQGQVIIQQGDVGDAFYMIEKGEVDVYIPEKSETNPVVTLKAGDFFGEKALLSSDVRTATCIAKGSNEIKCLLLMREDFVRMLGDLEYLLERTYGFREASEREGDNMMLGGGRRGKDSGEIHPTGEK